MAADSKKDKIYANQMRKAQEGDKRAYANLLREIAPMLSGFIHNRLGFRNDNEDILQEVLLAIHRSSHTYNTERPFLSWMFAIADHKVKDFLRSYYRKKSLIELDFEEVEKFFLSDVTNDPTSGEVLSELLSDLPEKQRKIIYSMKIEGYTAKEVAERMNMSESAVKVAAHRAYKILIKRNRVKDD